MSQGASPEPHLAMKIVSGGQTGVDRAALEFAIRNGIEHGGWCPRGRLAEDGQIPSRYGLEETASSDYATRTEQNVIDSDATLIITRKPELSGGTAFTHEMTRRHHRPVKVICEASLQTTGGPDLEAFLKNHGVRVINIAGPRESEAPGIGDFVAKLLETVLPVLKE